MKIDKWFHLYGRKDDIVFEEVPFEGLPSAQRKGKWINKNGIINCSVCRHSSWSMSFGHLVKSFNFCPNCGARMGDEDEQI